MEVMEEGNIMDRVPILLQRDLQYYQEHQCVLQEPICPGVVGGKLDFPRYASFASIKIVTWWEEEYYAAYRKYSGLLYKIMEPNTMDDVLSPIVKNSDPDKFVNLVTKSADLLLNHLHILSQESLDHADLTVLTATIGAAALIKNCLKIYLGAVTIKHYPPRGDDRGGSLKVSYKQYSQMAEALAERLLDLHCRLLLLYIVQDADCLNWEDNYPFFESERGSYTIQMWWHYMRCTKEDLWNSVPPKMAQRVFSGMLNETLSVLTVRYSHVVTSAARSHLHLVDITNLLFCVSELLPHVCESGEAYLGLKLHNQSTVIRDIHAKCQELFYCLLLRGAPLGVLSKVFCKKVGNLDIFSSQGGVQSSWIAFVLPTLFPREQVAEWITHFAGLKSNVATAIELKVLLSLPAPDWSFLVKVILMRDANLASIILHHLINYLPSSDKFENVSMGFLRQKSDKCGLFLCRQDCFTASDRKAFGDDLIGHTNCRVVMSLTYLLISIGSAANIKTCLITALENGPQNWCDCLDKRQVWNQKRPPWLESIMHLVYPILDCIAEMLINAVETGASMYQAMSLALTCICELWQCVPNGLYKATKMIQDIVSFSTKPLSDSVLLQVVFAALYTELLRKAYEFEKKKDNSKAIICYSLSEAICSIDEDDKHTEQINFFLIQAKKCVSNYGNCISEIGLSDDKAVKYEKESCSNKCTVDLNIGSVNAISEVLASDVITSCVGKQSLKVVYTYLRNNSDWLVEQLIATKNERNQFGAVNGQSIQQKECPTLRSMFYIGNASFDQLLIDSLKIDYLKWLKTPISLNRERAWLHVRRRFDFQEGKELSLAEASMIACITNNLRK